MSDNIVFFLEVLTLLMFFSIPFCIFLVKIDEKINMLLLPVLGLLNLMFVLFVYANINQFVNIKSLSTVFFSICCWLLEVVGVFFGRKDKFKLPKLTNLGHFLILLVVFFGLFITILSNYYDSKENKYFHPGYGINHDSIKILSSVKVLTKNIGRLGTSMSNSANDLYTLTGYPQGGSYLNIFFSQLYDRDPYFLYQRLLVLVYLLVIFVINYFVLNYFKGMSLLVRGLLIVYSALCVFNYLSLNIVNSSVLGSTLVMPFLLMAITSVLLVINNKINFWFFGVLFFLSMVGVVFTYAYFSALFVVVFMVGMGVMYGKRIFKNKLIWFVMGTILLTFLLPLNYSLTKRLTSDHFTSNNTELNLFKGMYGNTIGFINPITAFSLWFDNPDYRFPVVSTHNIWLFFLLVSPILFLIVYDDEKIKKRNCWRLIFSLSLPFLFFIGVSKWVTKSPYQNVKSMFMFSIIWLLILFLLSIRQLNSKKILIRLITSGYLLVYAYFVVKSALFACTYIGKPIVKSSYELMGIESEICGNDEKKLFLGRDEMSVYFFLSCKNITFYYDRMENNVAFWEVMKLNGLISLTQECSDSSLKLTKIDFSKYKKILIDKCFAFGENQFKLVKEFQNYRLYERKII